MTRIVWGIVVVSAVGFAGCLGHIPEKGHVGAWPVGQSLILEDCVSAGVRVVVPEDTFEPPVPPGWDGRNGFPTTVTTYAISCQHLSLGPFERGPIQVLLESHNKFNAAESCREGDYSYLNVLTLMVVSDSEVTSWMQSELGLPARFGQLTFDPVGPESVHAIRVSWSVESGSESWLQVARIENRIQDVNGTFRYVWAAGENLGLVDLALDVRQTQLEPLVTVAAFQAPMLLSALPFVIGMGGNDEEIFPRGDFKLYEGNECVTELSSLH